MSNAVVLFVPGYAELGSSAALSHRFAHALAVGGAGRPLVLAPGGFDALSFAAHVDTARIPGLSTAQLQPVAGDEQRFFAETHQATLESNPSALRAPPSPVLRDPMVAHLDDPEIGALRVLYSLLWDYSTSQTLRYGLQNLVNEALLRHARRPILVVAHGLGGLVVFDALFKVGPSAPPIELVTCGSPLGLRVVQRRLKARTRPDALFPIPDRVRRWVNVAGRNDLLAADPTLGDEFRWTDDDLRIDDRIAEVTTGWPYHRWEGYAQSATLRTAIAEFLARA